MHRERLTHLLATAIVELWKKETGSLSSVVIEGTICITSGTGKTTVLQVADRFSGSIPEAEDGGGGGGHTSYPSPESAAGRFSHNSVGVMRSFSMPHCYNESAPPRVDCQNQTAMAAFLDNLSPASLVSPGTDYSRSSRESRSPTALHPNREQTEPGIDVSSGSIKEELLSESGSDSIPEEGKSGSSSSVDGGSTGAVCPGTGYYTCATTEMNNNTIDAKCAHKARSPQSSPERNKRRHSRERSVDKENSISDRKRSSLDSQETTSSKEGSLRDSREIEFSREAQQQDAVDLTRKGVDDLALSPPQSYTAQVRDVIRQKLLAGKSKANAAEGMVGINETPEQRSPGASHQIREGQQPLDQNTPKVLETLGLQRNECEPRENCESGGPHNNNNNNKELDLSRGRDRDDHYVYQAHSHAKDAQHMEGGGQSGSLNPDELRVSVSRHGTGSSGHPLLTSPISPIISSGANMMTVPSPTLSTNGPLHSILRHRPFPTLPLSMHRTSMIHTGPSSAPPLFTHPGFSPLQNPIPQHSPRDASPSPTDLSLDSSGDSEKEVGPNGEQRVYRCEFCTKTFLFKSKYHEHLPVHTNARPFQCHLCSRTYKYKYDLRVHLRTHMGIPTKSTVCPFCNTKFDTNKRLRVHIKDAHRDKQKITEDDSTSQQQENAASPATA